jgi:hypothetical protein
MHQREPATRRAPVARPHASGGARALAGAAVVLAVTLGAAGCGEGDRGPRSGSGAEVGARKTIPQPVVRGLPVAPASERVDLGSPKLSDPTRITNPLFPVSNLKSVLLLGRVDGKRFRTEVTLLPETRIIEWEGEQVATLVSQYVAYLDGRIHEVAYDFYAQDDAGAVWYFGEDVFNFEDGVITDTHGTWIAGKDGPAAMIMPADPEVGDVYRPENIPGLVFEEVTVKSVDEVLAGPVGRVEGGLLVEELHMDASRERKSFAPGYGEFFTGAGGDVEALALAVPHDALAAPLPPELAALERGATAIFEAAGSGRWQASRATVKKLAAAWGTMRAGAVPARLGPQVSRAVEELASAVDRRRKAEARQAAIDLARWSLDLELRHRPVSEIDLARFDLWAAQLLVDAQAGDAGAVNGDVFSLDYVRDRVQHALDEADLRRVNSELEELTGAVADDDLEAAAAAARRLRDTVAEIAPTPTG